MTDDESFDSLLREVARAPAVDPSAVDREVDHVGKTLAHFRVIEPLGRGGMGCVYRAYDERLERDVALKVLRGRFGGDEKGRAALLREAQSAASVSHRGIAQIHEVGEADGVAFIAMELVRGETLRARLARGPVSFDDAMRIAGAIASALARAHASGIVHLDLKPENVMIDRDGEVKILDFGLARALRGGKTADDGAVRGTPAYMAPEQARGEAAGPTADVYAFGATLRELAPRDLASVVDACMVEDPSRRPRDGAALVAALDAVARERAWSRRRLRLALVAIAVLGGVGAGALYVRSTRPPPLAPTTSLKRLTANVPEVPIVHATISPDGRWIAYADRAGLHTARIGAAEVREIPPPPGGAPSLVAWAANGRELFVATTAGEGEGTLSRVAIEGGAASKIAEGAFTGIAPSADGTRLAVAETRRVAWIDAGGERHELVEKPRGCSVSELAWSPDGARLAYTALCYGTLGDSAIESVSIAGGPPERIVADPRLFNDAARAGLLWSPRGDVVYALAEWLPAESGSNLWSVAVDAKTGRPTRAPRAITSWVGTSASALSEDARGDRIAFVRSELQSDVYVADLASDASSFTTAPRRLTLSDRNERPGAWMRDGSGLFFFSDRTGNFDVFFQSIDSGAARPIAAGPAWETMPQLSPDGLSLLFWSFPPVQAGEAVKPEIVRRPLDGSASPVLVARALGVSHPAGVGRPQPWEMRFRCPRDPAKPCVLAEREGGSIVFRALDPIAGRGAELHRLDHASSAANLWDVSPDGDRLAFPHGADVRVHSLSTGADVDLPLVPECEPIVPTWSAAGDALFVTVECASAPEFRLYSKRLDGRLALLWSDAPHYVLETEASPDGRRLAIAVKRTDNDVWSFDRP